MGLMDEAQDMLKGSSDSANDTKEGLERKAQELEKKAAELRGRAKGYMNQA